MYCALACCRLRRPACLKTSMPATPRYLPGIITTLRVQIRSILHRFLGMPVRKLAMYRGRRLRHSYIITRVRSVVRTRCEEHRKTDRNQHDKARIK